jgi:hypothetical protein
MIAEEIIKETGGKYKSTSWYVNSLMNSLLEYNKKDINQLDTGFIIPGDLVFFMYNAKYPQRYDYWDMHPLSYIIEVNPREGSFFGSNLHYLTPKYREAVANSYLNKSGIVNAPKKTLHKYLFSGVMSDFFKVPEGEWAGVSLLPTEKFVDRRGQPVFKTKVWDAP